MIYNEDPATGIHYGVIPHGAVGQAWYDDSKEEYYECEEDHGDDECECDLSIRAFNYTGDGYEATQSHDDPDIFIMKSPFYTLAEYCSPCAPNAGYLLNPGAVKSYCFGHDWFEDGRAPYRVYRVDDDEEVPPPPLPIKCDQCAPSRINGIFCHEKGCPNDGKRWNGDDGAWEV